MSSPAAAYIPIASVPTSKIFKILFASVATLSAPATSNFAPGLVVPIPTLPPFNIVINVEPLDELLKLVAVEPPCKTRYPAESPRIYPWSFKLRYELTLPIPVTSNVTPGLAFPIPSRVFVLSQWKFVLLLRAVVPVKYATLFAAPPLMVPAPDVPALPLVPAEPDVPVLPLVPVEPELPDVPDDPDVPALPLVPELPDVPFAPEVPADPEVPVLPEEPDVPVEPELPLVPALPDVPELPLVPVDPLVPVLPEEPDVPVDPLDPEVPELPVVPEVPLDPAVPAGVNAYDAVPKNPTPFDIELVKDDADTVP